MVAAAAAPLVGLGLSQAAATAVATAGLYIATTAASYFLQQALMPEAKQETGTKLREKLGGAVSLAFQAGTKESAGSFLYKNTWGRDGRTPNGFLVKVQCIGDRTVEGFEPYVLVNGRKCAYDPEETQVIDGNNVGHPIHAFDSRGGHWLWVKFLTGSQSSADGYLRDKFGSSPTRPWTADMIGRGRPLMIVTQKYDKKEPQGELDVVAVPKRSRFYDWREDSTVGGSGSQRYNTYSTHGWGGENPAVFILNVMGGIYHHNEWLFGGDKWPLARFDLDSFTAAANKCDENVALAGGGTQKRFRMGAEVDCSEEPWTVVERALKACNGRIVDSGGVFKLHVGGIGAASLSFTDDDIIISEELTGRLYRNREDVANTVIGTYVEPDNGGETKAYKARTKTEYVEEDGGERQRALDFEYVRDNRQAQRLARLALNDNRRRREFTLVFPSWARKLEPCDVVNWTSARFGYDTKKFIVGDVILRGDGLVVVNLREANPADADWSTLDEDAYETGVYGDIDAAPQSLTATVSQAAITDDDGTNRRPAIRIQAALDDDFVDCRALLWEVRKRNGDQAVIAAGESTTFFDPMADPAGIPTNPQYGNIVITDNAFLPNKRVQVRWKIDPESDRETLWSNWGDTSAYPDGNNYLQLTNARLKVATPDNEYDVDPIKTDNVVVRGINDRAFLKADPDNVTWSNEDKTKKVDRRLGVTSAIDNPNPSVVFLRIAGILSVSDVVGQVAPLGGSGSIVMTAKLRIYSAPVDNNNAIIEGNAQVVYEASVTGSATRKEGSSVKRKNGSRKLKSEFALDIYEDTRKRKYWAQIFYQLRVRNARAAGGKASIKKFKLDVGWAKR